jgi:predicted nucleotidyltransferase
MDAANDKTILHGKSDVVYTRVSQSHLASLDEVVVRLTRHREVESIAILGSGAKGMLNPASDYDVLVVHSEMPVPVSLVLTTIAQRLAEVVFLSADTIEQWLTTETFDAGNNAGPMLRRLQKARVAFDRTGRLTRLYEKALSNSWKEEHNQQEMWEAWFYCNYDLQHTKRLLTSTDPIYLMAVDLRLLSGVSDLWKAYFLIRQVPWQGDKEAIRYLMSHDPDYLALLQQCLAEASREGKVQLYAKVAELTLAPLGALWSYDATAIELRTEGDTQPEVLQAAFAWWEDVISS